MCMCVLSVYMSMYHMFAWCLWTSEEGIRSLGTGNLTQLPWGNIQCSQPLSHSSTQTFLIYKEYVFKIYGKNYP